MQNCVVLLVPLLGLSVALRTDGADALRTVPTVVRLSVPEAAEQLLIWQPTDAGHVQDVTAAAQYRTTPAGIVSVSQSGQVTPLRDGRAEIHVQFDDRTATIGVEVTGVARPVPVSFRHDVIPILSKAGCNSGGCHGKAEGQNGFKLSIFGYDTHSDHQALTMEAHGRRVFPAAPERSLLLAKGAATVPHGGGRKFEVGSRWYRRIERWIAEGAKLDDESDRQLTGISVEPSRLTLAENGSQQLRVIALAADGTSRCVTAECDFQSNCAAVADVDSTGRISATDVPGEAAILVRHQGHVDVCRVTRPLPKSEFVRPPERNFIDHHVWNKLEELGLPASPLAEDTTFLRRASLDIVGTLPTVEQARAFLADTHPDKRQRLVASLLDHPLYVDYWSQRWADLLQVDKDVITPQGAVAFTRWIHRQLTQNVPYDEFARRVLTAEGATLAESPAGFFQVQKDPEKLARSVSQLFLGVRIECAQCHHHPFERWDQKDYFALAGFFTGVERMANPRGGLKIVDSAGADLKHPRTGELVPAAGLGASAPDLTAVASRRPIIAVWIASADNPYFTRAIANRMWAHYFGRGLVEPVDDLRATNPATNEPLLAALADHLVECRFDLKAFTRTLLDSRVYQLSSGVEGANADDAQNHSHASWKPLPAEVLLDAISQATGIPEEFNGWPAGYRAIQVWDNKLPSEFLEIFGRPSRQTVCACERDSEPSIAQALHLLNSSATSDKISARKGRAAGLATSASSDDAIIDALYLSTLTRLPTDAERRRLRQVFVESANRREAVEDILWTLLNTKEFVFNH